jgi:hypothetical protein
MKLKDIAFAKKRLVMAMRGALSAPVTTVSAAVLASSMIVAPAMAQQTGGLAGKVTVQGDVDPTTVTVTASSPNMPKPRSTQLKDNGSFNLPFLIPGNYTVKVEAENGASRTVQLEVLLDQTATVDITLPAQADDAEVITIVGTQLVRVGDSSLSNSLGENAIKGLPIGQSYRDLLRIVPGVEYTETSVLGPSAGGSGRDNQYSFDGVDVSLPLFGNLASSPSTHDIANVSIDRGGAKAVGFNRSGGFAINTTSKSGTNEFQGSLEYRLQDSNFVADRDTTDDTAAESSTLDKSWIIGSLSGPLIEDELFFYGSYYRPEDSRVSKETAYGPAKDYKLVDNEYFAKLTWAPIDDMLFNISLRDSEEEAEGASVGAFAQDSTSEGSLVEEQIFTLDGSYYLGDATTVSFSYSTWDYETQGQPDNLIDVTPQLGASLDLNNLDQLGLFNVPTTNSSDPAYDVAGAQELIERYGYTENGQRQGGGQVGVGSTINIQNFYRDMFEFNVDHEMQVGNAYHTLHFGFQWQESEEILARRSNGWGSISYTGGLAPDTYTGDQPVYYQAIVEQMSFLGEDGESVPPIASSTETYNLEINDTIEVGDFIYNVGVLISEDILYGQGLKENSNNVSGYELAPGHKYKMYTVDWQDMIQPRLGVTWQFQPDATVFANFASYNPPASSLARAASWARNTQATLNVYFDENGDYIGNDPRAGSSGKFFQEGMKPRRTDEFTIGMTKNLESGWMLRGHVRHREASHPWEDTWNYSREYDYDGPFGGVPDWIAAKGPYIPELEDYRAEVGGSSYVVAELDGAKNKYWEVSLEGEYFSDSWYINASYVWSHYYGNYDQDITSGVSDANRFIGSSLLADGIGRQLWDGKYGTLNGDRPHKVKVFGYYTTDWNANIGANFLFQSGDVWEAWDGTLYGYSSSTIRYAEPAGSRRESSHWQLDLNYRQDFALTDDINLEFAADIFNVFDKQTGYNYDPYVSNDTFGQPRNLILPRRLQLSVNLTF